MAVKRYGWVPDRPDQRDQVFSAPPAAAAAAVPEMDLRAGCPEIYDQGRLGSCTANALAAALEFDMLKQRLPNFRPSRLFLYFATRELDGTVQADAGASIRNAMRAVSNTGFCSERLWPYQRRRFRVPPPQACYDMARLHRSISYARIPRQLAELKGCLSSGFPFLFGFTAYESFETSAVAQSGALGLPQRSESVAGAHAVLAVGFDEGSRRFLVRNSWGPGWGMEGHFWMPYEYLLNENLSDDFWTIRGVS